VADGWRRAAAAGSAACVVAGTTAIVYAVGNGPGPGLTGYVSEAGIAGSTYAPTYRLGVFALAAGLFLLAVALRPAARHAAALLAGSAVATVLSGAVTCSDGCPLPPFEPATVADLVHGGASIAAVAGSVFAMLVVARAPAERAPRRLSAGAAALALPLSAAIGLAMLLVGRGPVVGVLERVLLTEVVLWAITVAAAIVFDGAGGRRPAPVDGAARAKDRR
jgi:Protein of unknown function (DUF998)